MPVLASHDAERGIFAKKSGRKPLFGIKIRACGALLSRFPGWARRLDLY